MEFTITKKEFLKGLQKSQRIINKKEKIPILSNILIDVVSSGIWIYATDLDISIKGFYTASVKKQGRFTINAKKVFDVVKKLPNADISISQCETKEREASELWINLSCGNYKIRLSGLLVDDFPAFPICNEDYLIKFESPQLKDMIRKTILSTDPDEIRSVFNGILLGAEGNIIKMVSTNGRVLSYIESENLKAVKKMISIIIPQKTAFELLKLTEDGNEPFLFSIYENQVVFRKGNFVLISKVIDDKFPDYEAVMPKDNTKKMIVDKDILVYALKRISSLSNEKLKIVKFDIKKGSVELVLDTEMGEAKEKIDVKYDGEEFTIGLNAKYILDILNAIDSDEIVFNMKGSTDPILLIIPYNENYKCVIMPRRLQ